ncbi:MAG: putative endonuclease [Paraglaciecola sp.]
MYIGVTSDLVKRVWQHKNDLVEGFSKNHLVHTLVYFEQYSDMLTVIAREKQLKKWKRNWKIHLIEKDNTNWDALYDSIL